MVEWYPFVTASSVSVTKWAYAPSKELYEAGYVRKLTASDEGQNGQKAMRL